MSVQCSRILTMPGVKGFGMVLVIFNPGLV